MALCNVRCLQKATLGLMLLSLLLLLLLNYVLICEPVDAARPLVSTSQPPRPTKGKMQSNKGALPSDGNYKLVAGERERASASEERESEHFPPRRHSQVAGEGGSGRREDGARSRVPPRHSKCECEQQERIGASSGQSKPRIIRGNRPITIQRPECASPYRHHCVYTSPPPARVGQHLSARSQVS